jgi:hypothetical protein
MRQYVSTTPIDPLPSFAGKLTLFLSFSIDEKHGEIEEPPLPLRSPPLRKDKTPLRAEHIAVEKKPFHQVSVET